MIRALTLLIVFLLASTPSQGQSLSPGDIAIIGVNAVNPDEFAFVVLTDIPQGIEIGFVDHGWTAAGSFRTQEDELFYSVANTLPKGSVVTIDNTGGAPRFAQSGDQIIAFQGSIESPSFIYGLNFEGAGVWQADATDSNTSALPTGLTNGSTAVAVNECSNNNHIYSGPTSGTKSELLSLIGDKNNWTCASSRYTFSWSFSVGDGSTNTPPQFVSATNQASAVAGYNTSFQYTAEDADGDLLTFGGTGLPTGASIHPNSGLFSWTPAESQVGQHYFGVFVTDGTDSTSVTVAMEVLSGVQQDAPEFTNVPKNAIVFPGRRVTIPFWVKSPESMFLNWTIAPDGLGASIETTPNGHYFNWYPVAQPDIYNFRITATDSQGRSASHDLFLAVSSTLFPGESGSELLTSLKSMFTPNQTLGYDAARDTMYARLDLTMPNTHRIVRGIYSGFGVQYLTGDPSAVMFAGGINAEHAWPQSMGAGNEPQKSDLHSLYPAKDNINSTRSNLPYADIPDESTEAWFWREIIQPSIPTTDIELYSEYASGRFEPPELVKGDLARAVFYFKTIYSDVADQDFFNLQLEYIQQWNEDDRPTGEEIRRSALIRDYQGNINPFIVDSTLVERLYNSVTSSEDQSLPVEFSVGSIYPNPSPRGGSVTLNLNSPQTTVIEVTLHNLLGKSISQHLIYPSNLSGRFKVPLDGLARGTYFLRISSGKTVAYRSVVVL